MWCSAEVPKMVPINQPRRSAVISPWCIARLPHWTSGPAWGWLPRGEEARPGGPALTSPATVRSSSWANGAQIPDPELNLLIFTPNVAIMAAVLQMSPRTKGHRLFGWARFSFYDLVQVCCRTSRRRGGGVCCESLPKCSRRLREAKAIFISSLLCGLCFSFHLNFKWIKEHHRSAGV